MTGTTCTPGSHYVPEGWEDLERGVCPRCGLTVVWHPGTELWAEAPGLRVIVVDKDEAFTITSTLRRASSVFGSTKDALDTVVAQLALQDEAQEAKARS